MKFIKNGFIKKIIIILIALMIFNIAIPKEVKAWDIAGILLKPIFSLIASILIMIDTTLGLFLNGASINIDFVGDIVDTITGGSGGTALEKLFIGPDTIFKGKVLILNANIFRVFNLTELSGWQNALR